MRALISLKAFHCPWCGVALTDSTQFADNPCQHLLFANIDEVGDFSYVDKSLQKEAEKALDRVDPVKALAKACSDTAVIFRLNTSAMGCGPVEETLWFCLQACPKEKVARGSKKGKRRGQ